MSEYRTRFRFGLRLLFLVVALFAACFAWRHAVEQLHQAERERMRLNLEYRLAVEERGRPIVLRTLEDGSLPNELRQKIARELPRLDARISAIREELKALEP